MADGHEVKISGTEVSFTEDNGKNADGSEALRNWTMNPDQAAKHVGGGMFGTLRGSAGDKSALADIVNEHRKEQAKSE